MNILSDLACPQYSIPNYFSFPEAARCDWSGRLKSNVTLLS